MWRSISGYGRRFVKSLTRRISPPARPVDHQVCLVQGSATNLLRDALDEIARVFRVLGPYGGRLGVVALSGEQWLDRVFRPTVAAVNRVRHDRTTADALRLLGDRLAAQVEALGDTGVLTDEQERAAYADLADAGIMPEIRSTSASVSGGAAAAAVTAVRAGSAPIPPRTPPEPPRLRGVLAGPRQLGQLDGRPVTLISVELWTDRLMVDLCTDPGQDYRDRRKRHTLEFFEWMRRQRRSQPADRPAGAPVSSPLQELSWELRDEHGTGYRRTGGSAGSEDYLDRQRLQWSPAPPPNLERLTLLATDVTGTVALNLEIPIPDEGSSAS